MPFYADLHVHSKFARATSSDSDLEHMALWAAKKGVTVLGTGDFTHPEWFSEIKEKLVPAEPGLFRLRPDLEQWVAQQFPMSTQRPTRFLLEVEISTIYKKGDKTRKVHHLHYVPDLASAERFIARLSRIGNLNADGRPILGLGSRDLLEITLETGEGAYLVPAHIWTPWFAVLGSNSGFDSIEECYGDLTKHIFALETGLSSDPPMNWRLSQLDRYQLVSNSDAHSPPKVGREACVFDCALDYWAIRHALESGHGYGGTVEFFPEEGKYHLDGHRACGVCLEPEETRKHGGLCPTCGKELTVGVMHRVDELADRADGAQPQTPKPFRCLVPLPEMLSEIHRVGAASRKIAGAYENLIGKLGSELFILEQAPIEEIRNAGSSLLAEGIARMREGRVIRQPGYDGEYGVIRVFTDDELDRSAGVSLLFEVPKNPVPPHPDPLLPGEGTASGALVKDPNSEPADAAVEISIDARSFRPLPAEEGRVDGNTTALHEACVREFGFGCDPLDGLDPEQHVAAEITDGPLLIIAGPGTGKTRTLTHRIANLVVSHGVPAEHILAVTFTNRAANEMRERLGKLIPSIAERVLVTTFHGLGYRILREHGARLGLPATFRIASEAERKALLVEKLTLSEREAESRLNRISALKRGAHAAGTAFAAASHELIREHPGTGAGGEPPAASRGPRALPRDDDSLVLAAYEEAMRGRGWLDFHDLIARPVQLLETQSDLRGLWRFVSVDEFQDIDARQYSLVKLLVPTDGNLCVIGDPDQSIYGFRGAEPRFFQRFAGDFPAARTVQLRRNYRSSHAIVQGALQAIAPSSLVEGRLLEALKADAARITIHESATDKAEAEFVVHTIEKLIGGSTFFSLDSGRVEAGERGGDYSFSDFAALYRTDAQADLLCEALARSGIPFQGHTHERLVEHPAVQTLLEAVRKMPANCSVLDRLKRAIASLGSERGPRAESGGSPDSLPSGNGVSVHTSGEGSSRRAAENRAPSACATLFLATLELLASRCGQDFARFETDLTLLSNADLRDPRADRVSLLTLHASKGLEFPVVFITGCEDGLLPLRFGADDAANLDEERRLFFVGMTRARERLLLSHARKRLWRGQLRDQPISPFIAAIQQELLERSTAPELKPPARPVGEQLDLFANQSQR